MDELSAFQGASPTLKNYEAELFSRADLVFTGGQSLYESKVNKIMSTILVTGGARYISIKYIVLTSFKYYVSRRRDMKFQIECNTGDISKICLIC